MASFASLTKLLENPKTAKFVGSLKHADLPKNWADDPEIVKMAEDAYREMGADSPFFKAWFGDSVVRNADGTPLEVYHGTKTRKKFDEFSKDKIGKGASKGNNLYGDGFYFTPDYYSAQTYGKNIKDAYLNLQNPSLGGDLKPGQDGFAVHGGWHPTYVALEPTQIKSVHNRGTFNPDDPNIYKGILGLIGTGAVGAALGSPEQAQAAEDAAVLSRFNELADAGALPGQRRAAEMARSVPVTYTSDPMRNVSLGARAVTEGVLGAPSSLVNTIIGPFTDFRFGNPGEALADLQGQAKPVTASEKLASDIVYGAGGALPWIASGAGMAKYGRGIAQGVGDALKSGPKTQTALGALLGMFGRGE